MRKIFILSLITLFSCSKDMETSESEATETLYSVEVNGDITDYEINNLCDRCTLTYNDEGIAVIETEVGYVEVIEVIDDNTLVSSLTPTSIDFNGSLDTVEKTLTRTDIEFSSINCNEIND